MKKNILYITRLDPDDIKSWSGSTFFILKCLKKNFSVISISSLSNRIRFFYVLKRFFFSIFGIKFDIDRPILCAKDFARQIESRIKNINYDAIITSEPYLFTFLKTNKPMYVFTDLTFDTYYKHYFYNRNIHKDTLLEGNYCEKIALNKCKKVILTSHWAINEAVKNYNIKKDKFVYVPFGANLRFFPAKNRLFNVIKNKNMDVCNFISSGVHWERKGMDKAINLVNRINEKGQKAKLYIVGAKPIKNNQILDNVQIVNFLDKNNIDQRKILENLYYKCHFNLLFSKSEGFGLVNAEASAFGLYSITHDIGGISGCIFNNLNGFRFKLSDNIDYIANYVIKIFQNKKLFLKKSYNSRSCYEKLLNWDSVGKKLSKIIN